MNSTSFVITGAQVFDGHKLLGTRSVLVEDGWIVGIDTPVSADWPVVDGTGGTLLPGLIDAHTHAEQQTLAHALAFGVTTELDMYTFPNPMAAMRQAAAERNDIADVRSAGTASKTIGGYPTGLIPDELMTLVPTVERVEDVAPFVEAEVAKGADYIKLIIERGPILGLPDMTLPSPEVAAAIVREAHRHGKLAVVHAMTLEAAWMAVNAGVDALMHAFVDEPPTDEIISAIADTGMFIVPTLVTMAWVVDEARSTLNQHPSVQRLLPEAWLANLRAERPQAEHPPFANALELTRRLRDAGVEILAGTDAAHLGAPEHTAHGLALHAEIDLLNRAGLSPLEALRAATSLPAKRFGLVDRGRIKVGCQADLLLVDGDPTQRIENTMEIRAIWRRGQKHDARQYQNDLAAGFPELGSFFQ